MADRNRPRSRHAEELAALVEERYGQMVGAAAKRLRRGDVPQTSADPEDVVQNALKAVLSYDKPIGNMPAFFYGCLGNEVRQAARRHYAGRGYASLDADVRAEDEPKVEPIARAEMRHLIDQALDGLPRQQQKALLLTREMGFTQEEAARIMGTATGTVGVHTHRAIKTLTVALAGLAVALVTWVTTGLASGTRRVLPGSGGFGHASRGFTVTLGLTGLITIAAVWLALAVFLPRRRYGRSFRPPTAQGRRAAGAAPSSSPPPPGGDAGHRAGGGGDLGPGVPIQTPLDRDDY
ncbi:sigma-70 family RNA polymerase sigma factor [Streptomyces sp. NPDC001904]|uniref:sigma-70 family RNA polymerase sigma factor n=1 Tax=Streptomyces sp. NPDC001904 TaxID=3154531 RepID=UPI0033234C25